MRYVFYIVVIYKMNVEIIATHIQFSEWKTIQNEFNNITRMGEINSYLITVGKFNCYIGTENVNESTHIHTHIFIEYIFPIW